MNNWTALPPFKLMGAGTWQVESFSYYVRRVEAACGFRLLSLSPSAMEVGASAPFFEGPVPHRSLRYRRIEYLEGLTGVSDLRQGSFSYLSDIISDPSQDLRFRWCPECLESNETSAWTPLVWTVPWFRKCPLHDCRIELACIRCGATQTGLRRYQRNPVCRKCHASLAGHGQTLILDRRERWIDAQLLDLVGSQARIGPEHFRQSIDPLELISSLGVESTNHISTLVDRLASSRSISLLGLMRIAWTFGCPIVELLQNPRLKLSRQLFALHGRDFYVALPNTDIGRGISFLHGVLTLLLRRHSNDFLPSFTLCVRIAGLNHATALEYVGHLCERYDRHQRSFSGKARLHYLNRALVGAVRMHAKGGALARALRYAKPMLPRIMKEFTMDESEARIVVKAYDNLRKTVGFVLRRRRSLRDAKLAEGNVVHAEILTDKSLQALFDPVVDTEVGVWSASPEVESTPSGRAEAVSYAPRGLYRLRRYRERC